MKKDIRLIAILVLVAILTFGLVACSKETPSQSGGNLTPSSQGGNQQGGGNENPPVPSHTHDYGDGEVTKAATYNADGVMTYTCSCGDTKTEKIPSLIPTAKQVVDGRAEANKATKQEYDFNIHFSGTLDVMGYSGTANAIYDGKYRYNTQTSDLKFYRQTSGVLLYDSKEYIYTNGDSRIKVVVDENNVTKRTSVIPKEDDELNMLNLPFVALVDALDADNINAVTKNSDSGYTQYKFRSTMGFASDNAIIKKLLNVIGKLGMSVQIKDVAFTNPQNGVVMYFNMSDKGVFEDFTYQMAISFPVKGQSVTLNIEYKQTANSKAIVIPSVEGLIVGSSQIATEMGVINSAINAVKNSDTYSLDLTAKNEFDPGWNKLAIVDKYIARMYKNVNDGRTDFNHSYEYKAHTEEDGAETFKYTIGNVKTDDKVWQISRKGGNTQTELTGISANGQFDYIVAPIVLAASQVDCISKATITGGTEYTVRVNAASTIGLQQIICDMINSNTAAGVIPVDNYFNSADYKIDDTEFVYVVKDGALVSATANIKLKYFPTSGDYTANNITLTNSIELIVNDKLDKAAEYEAPNKVDTPLVGLNNAKFYIL